IGSNTTDSSGRAIFNWEDSVDTIGNHTIACNITHDQSVFYNSTANNSAETFFLIETGNTTAELDINLVPSAAAENLTRQLNRTYMLYINITNNGTTNSMYDISVDIDTPAGVIAEPVTCMSLLPEETCNLTSMLNVTYEAAEGFKDIYVNVTWVNADVSVNNISAADGITVVNSTVLNITEESLNYTIPRGGSFQAGTFTIMSYGNTDLSGITINVSGGDAENISQWVSFTPPSVSSIAHMGDQSVDVFLDVPNNATEGVYVTNITANATGSVCSPAGLCWDYMTFTVNVSVHDWRIGTENINKTIGLMPFNGTLGVIDVINQKSQEWSFNVSSEGNITG
ncbi:MAG: hypothetical protein KAT35_04640, partial [Candidatus Aenigmarchaeota archaeon]|nr:hypothetical protein [Candidatus Aenigmarchaeota archaeon]